MITTIKNKTWFNLVVFFILVSVPIPVFAGNADDPRQEPTAIGDGGTVATEHPEASEASITILKQGGNAVDAAIAAAAVQGVTRPYSGGIGGGGIMNVYLKEEDRFIIIDHRTKSSSNFGPDAYMDTETGSLYPSKVRTSSGMATAVPSTVKAWEEALEQYGTMTFSEVLQPAIKVAESGFEADKNFIRETRENADRFKLFQSTKEVYLDENGEVPKPGTIMKNPDLAKTYRLIAEHGSAIFYEGDIAEAIVDTIHHPPVVKGSSEFILAGNMTLEDLSNYEVVENEATHVNYNGYDVYGPPPPSSGGVTIGEILNILEPYHLEDLPQKEAMHYYLEASRYAFADRRQYLGDPVYTENPVEGLLSKGYASERRQLIQDDRASIGQVSPGNPWPYDEDPDKQPDPPEETGKAFYYDFNGKDGDDWDVNAFDRIDTGPRSSPFDSSFQIINNTGEIVLNERDDGRGSAYGRASSNMEALEDSELLVRFRFDEVDMNQRMRLWLKSDTWASGSTMPRNGYGIELNMNTNELLFRGRQDSSSTILDRKDIEFNNDWNWLRFRVEGDELSVRLWNDGAEEPGEWDMVHQLNEGQKIDNKVGYFLLGAINFDYNSTNSFFFDDITVENLNVKDGDSKEPNQTVQMQTDQQETDEDTGEKSTIHLSVNDSEGNIVSYTTTIVSIGGNGMVVPGYGFLLNNALSGRTPYESPDHPNYPRPNFRSLSSMSPTIVMMDGEPVMTTGAPGSATIITTVTQIMLNHLDFGMSLPEAIEAPRLTQLNNIDGKTSYEEIYLGKYGSLLDELKDMGHTFKADTRSQGIGSATGLEFLSDGNVQAVAEPTRRGGGSAMAIDKEDIESPSDDIRKNLQRKVNEIKNEDLDESLYTKESWKAFRTALRIGEQLLKMEEGQLDQSILHKALSNLELAHEKLSEKQ